MKTRLTSILFFAPLLVSAMEKEQPSREKERRSFDCFGALSIFQNSESKQQFGMDPAADSYQELCDFACEKMGILRPISVNKMNKKTEQRNGNNIAFVMPKLDTVWVNETVCNLMPFFIRQHVIFHEIAHIQLRHDLKRNIEEYSGALLGVVSSVNFGAARLISFNNPIKFRFMHFGIVTSFMGLTKCLLDQTQWYQTLLQKWYKDQEKKAHKKALSIHPSPDKVVKYYTELADSIKN